MSGLGAPIRTSALARAIRRGGGSAPTAGDPCEMCAVPMPDRHRHVLDEQRDALLCVCQACGLLFERDAAGRDPRGREHFRLVPRGRRRLPPFDVGALGMPVGLGYLVVGGDGTVRAHYPSPLGITDYEIDPADWQSARRLRPELADLAPRVEAVLVHTARGAGEFWLVPIDDCHRLAALVRTTWRGMSGGDQVWPAIERFFAELAGPSDGHHPTTGPRPCGTGGLEGEDDGTDQGR